MLPWETAGRKDTRFSAVSWLLQVTTDTKGKNKKVKEKKQYQKELEDGKNIPLLPGSEQEQYVTFPWISVWKSEQN